MTKEERCSYCGQHNETKYMSEKEFICCYCRKRNDRFSEKDSELLKILEELK